MTRWLSPVQAAQESEFCVDTIGDALRSGALRGYQRKPGGRWRIDPIDLDAWVRGEPPPPVDIPRVTRTARAS